MTNHINRIRKLAVRPYLRQGIFVLGLAIIGLIALGLSRAATPTASVDAETGKANTNSCAVSDSSASGGQAVKFGSSSCSTALNIPRVPWEGGPAYWNKYSKAAADGWTNPSFFPIGNFESNVNSQSDIDKNKAVGINVFAAVPGDGNPETWANTSQLIKNNGMFSIPSATRAGTGGSEEVGYYLTDEPSGECDNANAGCVQSVIKAAYDQWQSKSPNDGRFGMTNFTADAVVPEDYRSTMTAEMNTYNAVVSADVYWYTFNAFCGDGGGGLFTYGTGGSNPDGFGYNNLSAAECHRSANYGYNVKQMRYYSAGNTNGAPKVSLWNYIETSHPGTTASDQSIQPAQLKGAVMASIINEARGILYFNYDFGSGGPTDLCNGDDPIYGCNNAFGQSIRDALTTVDGQIKTLAPVINTQSYQWSFSTKLSTMLKAYNGSYYIFAMPADSQGGAYTGTQTFQLPAGLNGATVQVLDENRSININASRQFSDSFPSESTYHIYEITP